MWLVVGILLIICLVCILCIWYASTHFHKVYYTIESDKVQKETTFVVLADLHDQIYGENNIKLLEAIENEQPSGILIAGDMLTATKEREKTAEHLVRELAKKYPVYYGLGNHEAKMKWKQELGELYEPYMKEIKDSKANILDNQFVQADGIRIYGLNIDEKYYKRFKQTPMEHDYIEKTLGKLDQTYFNILLAHNPMYFEAYERCKPDLVLSGHVHGGLVRLPFLGGVIAPNLHLFPKYDGGLFSKNGTKMIISRGLGIHSIEFRMWNTAELVVVNIVPTKE